MFLSNMLAHMEFVGVPIELLMVPYLDALTLHASKVNSPTEIFAEGAAEVVRQLLGPKLEPNKKTDSSKHPKHDQAKALYNSVRTKEPEKLKGVAKEVFLDMLKTNPKLIDWFEKLFETTLCACWISYEVLSGDLWEDLVMHLSQRQRMSVMHTGSKIVNRRSSTLPSYSSTT